jgi:excisionase family DNA binding protein
MRDTAGSNTGGVTGSSVRALATVTFDAAALESLGPEALEQLADLVAARLAERRATGDALLSCAEAGRLAGVHPETVRRAVRSGALEVAGYVGSRPRLRAAAVEGWIAEGIRPGRSMPALDHRPRGGGRGRSPGRRVLGEALRELGRPEGRAA